MLRRGEGCVCGTPHNISRASQDAPTDPTSAPSRVRSGRRRCKMSDDGRPVYARLVRTRPKQLTAVFSLYTLFQANKMPLHFLFLFPFCFPVLCFVLTPTVELHTFLSPTPQNAGARETGTRQSPRRLQRASLRRGWRQRLRSSTQGESSFFLSDLSDCPPYVFTRFLPPVFLFFSRAARERRHLPHHPTWVTYLPHYIKPRARVL